MQYDIIRRIPPFTGNVQLDPSGFSASQSVCARQCIFGGSRKTKRQDKTIGRLLVVMLTYEASDGIIGIIRGTVTVEINEASEMSHSVPDRYLKLKGSIGL